MKIFTTILLVICGQSILMGQEFAPIGATWIVEIAEPLDDWRGTLTNSSLRDTIVKENSCKVMIKSQPTTDNEISGEYIPCKNGDSIPHYIPQLDSFNTVMDFGAEIGESWVSFDKANDYVSFGEMRNQKYVVDSISYIFSTSNDSIGIQHLTEYGKFWNDPDSEFEWNGSKKLIQYLGFEGALLSLNDSDGFTDDITQLSIRCYEDNNIGLVKLTNDLNCQTTSINKLERHLVEIYPNPTYGHSEIRGFENIIDSKLQITDYTGRQDKISNSRDNDISHLMMEFIFIT